MPLKIYPSTYPLVLCVAVASGCVSDNPNRNPKAFGELDVFVNSLGNLCLTPLPQTAKIHEKGFEKFKTNHITDIWIDLTIHTNDNQLNNHIWTAKSINSQTILTHSQSICIGENHSQFSQKQEFPIDKGKSYTVNMVGKSDNGKHIVMLSKTFNYRSDNTIEYIPD